MVQSSGVTALSPDDAYTCALREVTGRQYTVTEAERAAGLIIAEKRVGGSFVRALSGLTNFDQLTITILPPASGAATALRINAATTFSEDGGDRQARGNGPRDEVKDDAAAIAAACAG